MSEFYNSNRTQNFTGREWVFEQIYTWLCDTNGSRYFLLTGEPGSGKTAICDRLTQFSQSSEPLHPYLLPGFLTAVHRCSARDSTSIDPQNFAQTIALQLAQQIPQFAQALKDIGEKQVNIRVEQNLDTVKDSTVQGVVINNLDVSAIMTAAERFNRLVLAPLQTIYHEGFNQPIIILVDALDEALIHEGSKNIVDLLSKLENLPQQLRFILTSRQGEARVENKFQGTTEFCLSAPKFSLLNQKDICAYIYDRFTQDETLLTHLIDIESQQQEGFINEIGEKSEGNFLYVRFLLDEIARGKRSLLDLKGLPEGLDGLYYQSLERVVELSNNDWRATYAPIMGVLSVAPINLTFSQLHAFVGQSESNLWNYLGDLGQFLEEVEPQDQETESGYKLYHQSLIDFLRQRSLTIDKQKRHNLYYLAARESHQQIADYYWERIKPLNQLNLHHLDNYAHYYLAYHLKESKRIDDLYALLLSFNWIQSKLEATNTNLLFRDYDFLPNDEILQLVQCAIRLSSHVLNQDKTQFAGQLLGRLLSLDIPEIQSLLEQVKQWKGTSWLCPLTPSLTSPGRALLHTFKVFVGPVWALAVTPDGQHAVSGAFGSTLKVWNLNDASEPITIEDNELRGQVLSQIDLMRSQIFKVAVTPDGRYAVTGSWGNVKVWNLNNPDEQYTLGTHADLICAIAVTSDNRVISASQDGVLKVFDLESGTLRYTIRDDNNHFGTMVVTPDGQHAISASYNQRTEIWNLKVWNLNCGSLVNTLYESTSPITAVSITPSKEVIFASDNTLKVCKFVKEVVQTLNGVSDSIDALAVTSDGHYAISGSDNGVLKVWNLRSNVLSHTLGCHAERIHAITVTSDERVVSASMDGTLKLWNLNDRITFPPPEEHAGAIWAIAAISDDQIISGSDDATLKVWNCDSGTLADTLQIHNGSITALAVLPDGRVVSASEDRTIKVCNLNSKEVFTLGESATRIWSLAVSCDAQRVISISEDSSPIVWNLGSYTREKSLENIGGSRVLAITQDGLLVFASGSSIVKLQNPTFNNTISTIGQHPDSIYAMTVTSDGQWVVSGSNNSTLMIWSLNDVVEPRVLQAHLEPIASLAAIPGKQQVVSVSIDHTLKVWDLDSETVIATYSGDNQFFSCAVTPDAQTIVAGDKSGRVHFLRLVET